MDEDDIMSRSEPEWRNYVARMLRDGRERMDAQDKMLQKIIEDSSMQLEIMNAMRGGMKVLGWLGSGLKWLGGIGAGIAGITAIWHGKWPWQP